VEAPSDWAVTQFNPALAIEDRAALLDAMHALDLSARQLALACS
jgi:hypothetical protein